MQPAFARTPKHSTALIRLHLYTVSTELVLGNASKVKVCNIYCTADLQRAWMEVRKRICHCLSPGGTRGHTGQDTVQFTCDNIVRCIVFHWDCEPFVLEKNNALYWEEKQLDNKTSQY